MDRPAVDRADEERRLVHALVEERVVELRLQPPRRPLSGARVGPEGEDGHRLRSGVEGGFLDGPALRARRTVGAEDVQGGLGVAVGRPEGPEGHVLLGPAEKGPGPPFVGSEGLVAGQRIGAQPLICPGRVGPAAGVLEVLAPSE